MDKEKPILLVDFDGVIHSYISGWQGADVIPDDPVPGAFAFLYSAMAFFHVNIYSSRTREPGGVEAMKAWFSERPHPDVDLVPPGWWKELYFPEQKPAAFLTIDDRCIRFDGIFPDPETLLSFKPWNKSPEEYPPSWACVVLMVSESGEMHAIGGDREPGEGDTPYIGLERIKRYISAQCGATLAGDKR